MSFHQLPSSSPAAGGGLGRVMSAVLGLLVWAMLAMLGLVFAASLAIWLVVMVVVSLISSLFTGRPAAVTVLWRRYRDLTRGLARQRWPQGDRRASTTPRADATSNTGAATPTTGVQDVGWREVGPSPADAAARAPSHP